MTDDDILRMAIECQLIGKNTGKHLDGIYSEALMRFARMAMQHEREECAKICDDMDSISDYYTLRVELICAQAIRARSNT